MKRHQTLRTGIVLGSLAALMVVGLAGAQSAPRVGSGDVVADRQRLMKLNGASLADIQAKVKAGNIEAILVNVETISLNAMHIPVLFPQGSLADKSRAKPEIWQNWAEFESAAKNLVTRAEKLRDTARTKDAAATEAIVKDFFREACDTCHRPFRKPPPR